jgi:RNA polymerase-binding transcription factor DksA
VREFEALLLARRDELLAALGSAHAELAGIRAARSDGTADDEHDPEGSTLAEDWSRTIGLNADARRQLDDVDAALTRIANGTYGRCEVCDRVIPAERLRARPAATTCVVHAR